MLLLVSPTFQTAQQSFCLSYPILLQDSARRREDTEGWRVDMQAKFSKVPRSLTFCHWLGRSNGNVEFQVQWY